MEYENEQRGYEDDAAYSRDRSRSPRADRDGDARIRDAADDRPSAPPAAREEEDSPNEGSNLFCTGIHPRLVESDIQRLFEKYGDVESCSIMRDPHTRESRGFGFVKMVTSEQADAAKNGLNGETIEGRTLSIEKARQDRRGGGRFGGGDRYGDDRRGGYGRRDDYRDRSYRDRYDDRGGYRDRYDDRGYGGGGRRDRDDYGGRGGGRDDYGGRGGGRDYERRGGSYDRAPRDGAAYTDSAAAPARSAGGYDDDRYARR
ncbi:RNA recognition motif-containing protein 26 [Elsinoe fawcettii]|nr:RNA recognition motif-containing protein 26 [Elsinoe fawcettii]